MNRRPNISFLILLAVGIGIVTWATSLSMFIFPQGKGWSFFFLLFCIGINLLILLLYKIIERLALRFGLVSSAAGPGSRVRAIQAVLGLAAMALAFPVVLIWRPVFSPYLYYFHSTEFVDQNFLLPIVILALLLALRSIGLLVRRSLREGGYLFAFAMLFILVWGWTDLDQSPMVITDLRFLAGDAAAPQNDFLVFVINEREPDWTVAALNLVIQHQPRQLVVLPWAYGWSPEYAERIFSSLSLAGKTENPILIGLPRAMDFDAQKFSQLDFGIQTGYSFAYRPEGEAGLPDVTVRLAQQRGIDPTKIERLLEGAAHRNGVTLIDSYSDKSWRRNIAGAVAESGDSTWSLRCFIPGHFEFGAVTFRFDRRTGRLLKSDQTDSASVSVSYLAQVFRDKTVIVSFRDEDLEEMSRAQLLSLAVLNLENDQVPYGPPSWISMSLILLLLGTNLLIYYRMRPLNALGLALFIDIAVIGLELVLFSELHILVGFPLSSQAALLVVVTLIFFPYEFVRESQEMAKERTRLNTELRTAHDMQMGLMPKEDPVVAGFDISGICLPANEVGGDFYDYVWLDQKKTKLGIAVADVSGKAMKAAITAVMTSGMIYREVGQNESPKSIMRKINKPMYAKLDSRMFTALSFAVIDMKKKELRFSNAGQAYPVLKRGKEVMPLEVKGARLPLGVKEDVQYGEMVVKLKKEDTVIFYTDGIPEAKNEKDEFYGFDRFKALAGSIEGASAKEIRDRILEDVKSFSGKSPQYDDMTVVVVQVD